MMREKMDRTGTLQIPFFSEGFNSKTKLISFKEVDGLFNIEIYFELIPNLLITISISTEIGFVEGSKGAELLLISFVL